MELAKTDEDAKRALINKTKAGCISAIKKLVDFASDSDAIIELNNRTSWYGINGLTTLSSNGDEEAKSRLFEIAHNYVDEAIGEIYYLASLGDIEAKKELFAISRKGKYEAIFCLKLLAQKDKDALDLLFELSTDRTDDKNSKYGVCFAIRELIYIIDESARRNNKNEEIVGRIIKKLNEIVQGDDYEVLDYLRSSIQNIKYDVHYLCDVYPDLEPLITLIVGKQPLGTSIYDLHCYDKTTVTFVTRFSPYPDEKHKEYVR